MIEHLELRSLAAFADLTMELSPKINVIIGENGAGKTHLLKAAYGLCAGASLFRNKSEPSDDELEAALTAKLLRLFMPLDDKLGKMHRQGATDQTCLAARFAGGRKMATHDYVLLKWLDLLKGKDDHVRFHGLHRDGAAAEIKVASTEDCLKITPNPIDEAFGLLVSQEIENDMGGLGK